MEKSGGYIRKPGEPLRAERVGVTELALCSPDGLYQENVTPAK